MDSGPDPLGKRALFWMPVGAEAVGDDADADGEFHGTAHARPAGKHALFSTATPAGEVDRETATATAGEPVPPRGVLTVVCSRCGSVSRVGLLEFAALHFPVGGWLPRRTFDRWITCPACRRRSWTSVSLTR